MGRSKPRSVVRSVFFRRTNAKPPFTTESISWIAETLASLQSSCPPSLILDLRIFVTQASSQAALLPDSGSSDGLSSRHASVDSDEKRIEKKAIVGLPLSLSRLVKGGRPNFESLMEEVVQGAQGRAINVSSEHSPNNDFLMTTGD